MLPSLGEMETVRILLAAGLEPVSASPPFPSEELIYVVEDVLRESILSYQDLPALPSIAHLPRIIHAYFRDGHFVLNRADGTTTTYAAALADGSLRVVKRTGVYGLDVPGKVCSDGTLFYSPCGDLAAHLTPFWA